MALERESELYSRLLFPLRHGCALWCPEPNAALSAQHQERGIRIGDVGIVRPDGGFDFMFNVVHEARDPVNELGVPEGFVPLKWDEKVHHRPNHFRANIPLCSREAKQWGLEMSSSFSSGVGPGVGGGIGIKFDKDKGAVLMLPQGGSRSDCLNRHAFRSYAMKHTANWYRFVNTVHGREAPNGSVYLITGFDKAWPWENAVVQSNSREQSCELKFTPGAPGVEVGLKLSYSSLLQNTVSSRCSSNVAAQDTQAIFIRGFRVSVRQRSGLWAFLLGSTKTVVSSTEDHKADKDIHGKTGGNPPFSQGSSTAGSRLGLGTHSSANVDADASSGFPTGSHNCDMATDTGGPGSVDGDVHHVSIEDETPLYHPLTVINDYVLASTPNAQVAVTHDEDWMALLTDDDVEVPGDRDLIDRLNSGFSIVVKEGCATLEAKATAVHHKHEHRHMIHRGIFSHKVEPTDARDPALIALMGATDCGKTTFIDLLSGGSSGNGTSPTSSIELSPAFVVGNRAVALIDTPGFDDVTKTETEILNMLAVFLSKTLEEKTRLTGIIYLHRISDMRVSGISARNIRIFRELCGEDTLKNVVIVTNRWEEVPEDSGEAREEELRTKDIFFKPALDKGARMVRHNNTHDSASTIVKSLVVNHEVLEVMKKHNDELERIKNEMQALTENKDEEARQELDSSTAVLQGELAKAEENTQRLARDYNALKVEYEEKLKTTQTAERRVEELQAQVEELQQMKGKKRNKKLSGCITM
ncbi:hypothetical protein PQX77_013684 [Marasmius sp. AFHP31]|nr:hypothetical protein PQX77_013684 [Marasmius sp. AFHP31]